MLIVAGEDINNWLVDTLIKDEGSSEYKSKRISISDALDETLK